LAPAEEYQEEQLKQKLFLLFKVMADGIEVLAVPDRQAAGWI
jgi:hypothetical protein